MARLKMAESTVLVVMGIFNEPEQVSSFSMHWLKTPAMNVTSLNVHSYIQLSGF